MISLWGFDAGAGSDEEVRTGARLYSAKACHACHGQNGAAPIADHPALAGQSENYLLQQMIDIRNGERVGSVDAETGHTAARGMAFITHGLTEAEMGAISKYLAAQTPATPAGVDPARDPALLDAGAQAYDRLGCRTCHGPRGDRAGNPAYPVIAGLDRAYLQRAMTEIRDKVRTSGAAKRMWGTIKNANDAEIAAIARWLASIDRTAQ